MAESLRVQARHGVTEILWRDAMRAAELHGRRPVRLDAEGDGNTVETVLDLPEAAVIVTGGHVRGTLGVVTRHNRHEAWAVTHHALVAVDADGGITASSPWAAGPWGGDTTLRAPEVGPRG